jgi:hypothetical protein
MRLFTADGEHLEPSTATSFFIVSPGFSTRLSIPRTTVQPRLPPTIASSAMVAVFELDPDKNNARAFGR